MNFDPTTGPVAPGMASQIAAFARLLRSHGIPTHPAAVLDACRAAAAVGVAERQAFYWALRANFVTAREQFPAFDRMFEAFWEAEAPWDDLPRRPKPLILLPEALASPELPEEGERRRRNQPAARGASAEELLLKKDLRSLAPDEETRLHGALQLLLAKLFTRPGRRYRTSSRGRRIEFRGTLRRSVRSQGEFLTLVRREPKLARRRIALLGDVSGSMDAYSRFFLRLAHGIARLEPRTEVYAFSTRLFRLTEAVHQRDFASALEGLGAESAGWSGGTRIGDCLKEFNDALSREAHLRQVIAVIFSDGWDRGEASTLRREIVRLKGAAARLYWLNPLKGDPDYRPLCRGMSTALPYLDGFFAAHNAESLARFARRLARVR